MDASGGAVSNSDTVCAKYGVADRLLVFEAVRDLVSNSEGRLDSQPIRGCSSVGSMEVAVMSCVLCTS